MKATAIALRGTLHSVTASAPLVACPGPASSHAIDATPPTRHRNARAGGMFFFATIEPFHLADSETKKTAKSVRFSVSMRAVAAMAFRRCDVLYTQVLAAPVKIPLNIIRGRSPFHGIAGIGEKKEKKKEEPPAVEEVKAAAAPAAAAVAAAAAPAPAAPKAKKWFWQKDPIPEANPEEKIKPAPAWAVSCMLVVWYGAALVLNGTFRSALVQDLGARGVKEALAAEARVKMGL